MVIELPSLSVDDILRYPDLIPQEYARDQLSAIDPLYWAQRFLTTEKGEKLEFSKRRYLKAYLRDFHPHIVVKKGAQIGLSTTSITKLLWLSDYRRVTSIYTMPTSTDVSQFSSLRLKPMIVNSPYMLARMKGVDNAGVKQIGNSTIYFRGTMTERQAISIPADLLSHDELDFSSPDVREVYGPRLSVSEMKYIWEFSTPTVPKFGIDGLYELSDKKVWMVKCSCGRWQTIDYFKNILKRKHKRLKSKWYYGCKKCGKLLQRNNGEWITLHPRRTLNNRGIRGYFIPQTICPVISADYLVEQHNKSKLSSKGERTFFRFNLGLAYESGSAIITRDLILSSVTDPGTGEYIFMGVDQGDLLHIEICKVHGERREVIYLEVTDKFSRVGELIEQFNPMRCVIDAMPNKHPAKQLAEDFPSKVWIAYYSNQEGLWNPRNPDKEKNSITINHLDAMDNTAAQWSKGQAILTTAVSNQMKESFANQMVNIKRDEIEDKNGQNIPRWVKVGADHFRHADLYAYIASQMPKFGDAKEVEVGGYIAPPEFTYSLFSEDERW